MVSLVGSDYTIFENNISMFSYLYANIVTTPFLGTQISDQPELNIGTMFYHLELFWTAPYIYKASTYLGKLSSLYHQLEL